MHLTPLEPWIARKIGVAPEPLTRTAVDAYQLAKVRETLAWARTRSPFYAAHLADAPTELFSLEAFSAFPFTTPEELRASGLQFLCVSQDAIHRVVTLDTSGTTGDPKRLYFTKDDQELTIDFFHVGMSTFTDPGDRVLVLLPGERPGSVGDLLALGLARLGAVGIKHGLVRNPAETLMVMAQERVDGVVGVPTQVLSLARQSVESGLQLKSVLLSTDYVPRAIVAKLEQIWGCRVYNHYGTTETGLGGGVDCQARRGYHLREADLYVEIVDPATGVPLAEGMTGEVVFTTLTRRGMPLIRYRTGDLGRFIPGACPCGTVLRTLGWITDRRSNCVPLCGGTLRLSELDEALFPIPALLDFSAVLTADAGRDCLTLEITAMRRSSLEAVSDGVRQALERLPVIVAALRTKCFDLRVWAHTEDPALPPRFGKRTLMDGRTVHG
ncbi:MAG: AMP-binding protein [Anaerolineae bacterium]|jgi:phenylacetate-coenzyme A ligase PaaK-like adenylate-forming protein|nr:AMP-binding protein [Anaerolineae bacterium]